MRSKRWMRRGRMKKAKRNVLLALAGGIVCVVVSGVAEAGVPQAYVSTAGAEPLLGDKALQGLSSVEIHAAVNRPVDNFAPSLFERRVRLDALSAQGAALTTRNSL